MRSHMRNHALLNYYLRIIYLLHIKELFATFLWNRGRNGRGKNGQGKIGQGKFGHGKFGHGKTGQGKTGQGKFIQNLQNLSK